MTWEKFGMGQIPVFALQALFTQVNIHQMFPGAGKIAKAENCSGATEGGKEWNIHIPK